ncbi:MAG: putative 2-aminoethylphosphonate ABC transporter substrate-binding protein [Alphaproteobacteria bacterium]|nr:putative 2-aminoethylphosphonate ABC transporter substrate-binding protein [Alphaproteobacteria bacterium]
MTRTFSNMILAGAVAALSVVGLADLAQAQTRTRVTVYSALEADQIGPLKAALEARHRDVEIQWVRDSTGVITARLLAERANPQADVVWGLALSSILFLNRDGQLFEPYAPAELSALKPVFRDSANPPVWTGMDAFLSFVAVNQPEAQKVGMTPITRWDDLLQPSLRGRIVMPNPASSGTGYLQVAAWLQSMGEERGWQFMDRLHENIGVYTHSGSAPHVQAARGERVVSIGLDMRAVREKTQGAPIDILLPQGGIGWEMEATALVRNRPNAAAARKVIDFSVSREAHEMYARAYAVVGRSDVSATPRNYPSSAEAQMLPVDFARMAADRDRVLAEWTRRYDGKSAPR